MKTFNYLKKTYRDLIGEYDPNYSAASLDEAYLDITDHLQMRQHFDVTRRTFPKNAVT